MRVKVLVASSFLLASVFLGCKDDDSDAAKSYENSKNLDRGNYDTVIRSLGDCMGDEKNNSLQSSCTDRLSNQQKMDLGAAYMGKAGYTLVSLGQELTGVKDGDSNEVIKIIMRKLDNGYMSKAVKSFQAILPNGNSSLCSEAKYSTLTQTEKQACISLNPILLKYLLDGNKNSMYKSDTSISLEQIISFKNVLKDAVPELSIDDVVDVINNEKTSKFSSSDVNGNSLFDSVEATDCVLNGYNSTTAGVLDATLCASKNITLVERSNNLYSGNSLLNNIKLVEVTVATSSSQFPSQKFFRLVEKVENSSLYSTLATVKNSFCDNTATVKTSCSSVDITQDCLPCPVIENGKVRNLNDSVVSVLNDEKLLKSIAIAVDSESSLSESAKLDKFKKDLCGSSNCSISQSDLLKYMN